MNESFSSSHHFQDAKFIKINTLDITKFTIWKDNMK